MGGTMKAIHTLIIAALLLSTFSIICTDTTEAALTVSPTLIFERNDLLRGSDYWNTIWLYNLD